MAGLWSEVADSERKRALIRVIIRVAGVLLWTLLSIVVQSALLLLPGRGKVKFARVYWRGVGWFVGLKLNVAGQPTLHRPALFIANHCSWLDIVSLGSVLPACFIAKAEIARWPGISIVAKLGRTIFVSRNRQAVAQEQRVLEQRLKAGDSLILFPEGTTSDGNRVRPFGSAFFTLAFNDPQPWVQPVTVVYDEIEGQPVRRFDRQMVAWHGDMDLWPHLKQLLRRGGLRATIVFGEPVAPGTYTNRKTICAAMEQQISSRAAALRQGRPETSHHEK